MKQQTGRQHSTARFTSHLLLVSAAAGAAAAPTACLRQGNCRLNSEARIGEVNLHAFNLSKQLLVDAEGKPALIFAHVLIRSGIQCQGQVRPAATAGGEVYANGALFFTFKKGRQVRLGAFGQFKQGSSDVFR